MAGGPLRARFEVPEANAAHSLRQTLYKLRQLGFPVGDARVGRVIDLDVDAGKLPMVHGSLGTEDLVIYDGSGFAPSFADHSWVSQVGQKFSFSLLPMGGWHKTPIAIKPGQFAEASPLADQALSLDRDLSQYASIADAAIGESGIRFEVASSQRVSVVPASQTGLDPSTAFTAEIRVRQRDIVGSRNAWIGKWHPGADEMAWVLDYSESTGFAVVRLQNEGKTHFASASFALNLPLNRYERVTITFDATKVTVAEQIRLWADGAEVAIAGTTGSPITALHDATANFTIGAHAQGGEYFEGDVDYARFFKRICTDAEIASGIYASTEQRGYWEFRGVSTDLSGNGNDLTPANAPTYLKSLDLLREFTIAGWFRFDEAHTQRMNLISRIAANSTNISYKLHRETPTQLWLMVSADGSTTRVASATFAPTIGEWYFIAATFDPGLGAAMADCASLWVNGVDLGASGGSAPPSTLFQGNEPYWIGAPAAYDGASADVQVFNRAWSASELAAMQPANLIGLCTDNSLDGVLTDDSGHSNTLVAQNGAGFAAGPRPAIAPVAGQLAATEDAARHTPISVSVESLSAQHKPIVWARVGDNPWQWHTVYDGDNFNPLFAPSSVENSGGIHAFSVLPLGGWWRGPVELTWGTFEEAIHVPNQAPVAAFTPTPSGLTVDVEDNSSDPDGTIVAWSITWGDGSEPDTGPGPWQHVYPSADTYDITLTVTDDEGAESSVQQSVEVSGGAVVVPTDGPNNWYMPSEEAHFTSLGLTVPDHLCLCQDASGALAAAIGGVDLLTTGSGHLYAQAVPDWTRTFVGQNEDADGKWYAASADTYDVTSESVCIVGLFWTDAAPTPSRQSFGAMSVSGPWSYQITDTDRVLIDVSGSRPFSTPGISSTGAFFAAFRYDRTNLISECNLRSTAGKVETLSATHSNLTTPNTDNNILGSATATKYRCGWLAVLKGAKAEQDFATYIATLAGA